MEFQTPAAVLVVLSILCLPSIWRAVVNNIKLSSIPTVGCSGFFTSYIGALRFFRHAQEMVQEGYDEYRGAVFKVPMMTKWMVVISGPSKIDEFRRATDDILSIRHAIQETFHLDLTIGSYNDQSTATVVKTSLTRNIEAKFSDVQDEITTAFEQYIPAKQNEWLKITAFATIMDIVCRTTNRLLVGLPLCREPDYLSLNKQFTIDLVKSRHFINMFPSFLRSIAARFCTSVPNDIQRGMNHLGPLIRERLEKEAEYGKDGSSKPNDMVDWLLDIMTDRSIRSIAVHMLLINFAAIHTTTVSFTRVIYDLATHPEYAQPMREEVQAVLQEEGWSKGAIDKLYKLDSFIKESLRTAELGSLTMTRKVIKDFTFSDGTMIPAGNLVSIAGSSVHTDADNYVNPRIFDGFRFERMRNREGEDLKHQLVSLDRNYLSFGQGRHACPGRFFAANELKTMLAHVLLNYDVKMAVGDRCPSNWQFGTLAVPDPTAEVLFRRRT